MSLPPGASTPPPAPGLNLQTAFLSPPVATAAYYLKVVARDWNGP